MAFTYDVSTDRGKVRLLIGDTDTNDQLLQDNEIDFFLTQANDNVYLAAAYAAEAIAATFSRKADTDVESVSIKYSQRSEQYRKLSSRLEGKGKRVKGSIPSPSITGISHDAIRTQRQDEDRVQEKFNIDRFSNPPNAYDLDEEDLWS